MITPSSGDPSGSERQAIRGITARPLEDRPGSRWTALLAVMAALAVAGIVWGVVERSRRGALEDERVAAASRGDSLAAALATRDSMLAGRPGVEELLAILAAPDVASFSLAATASAGAAGARGSLVASPGGAIVSASGLPAGDGEYVLWHVDDAGPHRVAGLGPTPDGRVLALLEDASFATGWGAIQIAREDETTDAPGEVVLEYRGFLR